MTTTEWARLVLPIPPRNMTYAEFLDWADEDLHAEWVDGRVEFTHLAVDPETLEITMSVTMTHSLIVSFLVAILQIWNDTKQAGRVLSAPYQMKTGPELPGREPDVLFVTNANKHRIRDKYLNGPADVAFEIVSEESATRDRIWKLAEYERGGVAEYWIIDPIKNEVLLYCLGDDGKYGLIQTDVDGILRSRVMNGVWFDPDWFWEPELPSAMSVLREWGILT